MQTVFSIIQRFVVNNNFFFNNLLVFILTNLGNLCQFIFQIVCIRLFIPEEFSIFGSITLNPAWFFSAGIVYYGAALFNLMAIYVHGTAYNQIYIGEIVLGTWPTLLALTIIYQNKSSN